MRRAVSVDPVKTTPATRGSGVSAAPTEAPSPGRIAAHTAGTPASCRIARKRRREWCLSAVAEGPRSRGECRAHLPVEDGERKIHGLMQANHTDPRQTYRRFLSGRARSSVSAENSKRALFVRNSAENSTASRTSATLSRNVLPASSTQRAMSSARARSRAAPPARESRRPLLGGCGALTRAAAERALAECAPRHRRREALHDLTDRWRLVRRDSKAARRSPLPALPLMTPSPAMARRGGLAALFNFPSSRASGEN